MPRWPEELESESEQEEEDEEDEGVPSEEPAKQVRQIVLNKRRNNLKNDNIKRTID